MPYTQRRSETIPRPLIIRFFQRQIAFLVHHPAPLAIVVWLFFLPFLSSAHLRPDHEDQWSPPEPVVWSGVCEYNVLHALDRLHQLVAVLGIAVFLCGLPSLRSTGSSSFCQISALHPLRRRRPRHAMYWPPGTLEHGPESGRRRRTWPSPWDWSGDEIAISLIWKNLALAEILVLGRSIMNSAASSRRRAMIQHLPAASGRGRPAAISKASLAVADLIDFDAGLVLGPFDDQTARATPIMMIGSLEFVVEGARNSRTPSDHIDPRWPSRSPGTPFEVHLAEVNGVRDYRSIGVDHDFCAPVER